MFTGLIQDIGTVTIIHKKGDWRIRIETQMDMTRHSIGASIACGGCCLTVIEKGKHWFDVEVSQESLSKTNIGQWENGTRINLEPSLRMGDELGGHFVFGHVDGLARIEGIKQSKDLHVITLTPPRDLMQFIAPKGSIALNGVSLTVNNVHTQTFTVNIIPHTWTHTTFQAVRANDELNIEIDMLARYVARQTGETP